MREDTISPPPGSNKNRKRVGRGNGSGHGNYSGYGCKGEKQRAGRGHMRPGFEGGQLPLIKRLPHTHGFTNKFRQEYNVINLGQLNVFESGAEVTLEALAKAGLVKSLRLPVKILADGELKHPLTILANKFSSAAKAKIEAAGGKVEEVEYAAKAV
ncbi:MAG: 50S ribosomal protein L15 [Chloroflexi bacterium]|nr:50S ribosomal protein L15 [Chloroflexota bacterium]